MEHFIQVAHAVGFGLMVWAALRIHAEYSQVLSVNVRRTKNNPLRVAVMIIGYLLWQIKF